VGLDVYKLIGVTFGNTVSRAFLKGLLRRCKQGNYTMLEHALAIFAGAEKPRSLNCYLNYLFLSLLINSVAGVIRADVREFKEYAYDPAVRRGLVSILRGIIKYGITRPQKLDAPFLIVWNFTNMCNLKCKHCYQRADKPLSNELTLKEKLKVVRQLDEAGVAALAFSGGEPLIHPHFLRVAEEASKRNMYVAVATNGTLITEDFAKEMKKAGVRYVEISLDSADPKKHDGFRGVSGTWKRAVEGVRNSVKMGFTTAIAITLTRLNIGEIRDVIELAERLGVDRVIFFNFIPVGRGEEIVHLDLSPEEREEALRLLYDLVKETGLQIVSTAPQYARVTLTASRGREISPTHFYVGGESGLSYLADFIGGCGAGRIYAAIQPNGDVTPCVFMPQLVVGNVREKPFDEIWHTSEVFAALRDRELLKGHCSRCPFKYICGGCRARALAYLGDVLAPDPGCIYNKGTYIKVLEALEVKEGLEALSERV